MIIKLAESNGLILINFGSSFVNELSNKKFDQIDKKVENWKIKNKIKLLIIFSSSFK